MDNFTFSGQPPCNTYDATFQYMSINVVSPVFFFVGLPTYLLALILLFRYSLKEGAYIYQVLLIGSKALEMFASVLLTYANYGAGMGLNGLSWYKSSYFLMFYTAHVSVLANQFALFLSLYLAAFMALDRLYAMLKPVAYRQQNRLCRACIAVLVSSTIAVVCSAHFALGFNVAQNDQGIYSIKDNPAFLFSNASKVMLIVTMALRVAGVAILLICNALLVYYFRQRFVNTQTILFSTTKDSEQKRKSKERPLFLLTFWQSAFCSLAMTEQIIFYVLLIYLVDFKCYNGTLSAVDSMLLQVINLLEIIVPFVFNDQLRSAMARLFSRNPLSRSDTKTRIGTGN